jgi:hypothetical protein
MLWGTCSSVPICMSGWPAAMCCCQKATDQAFETTSREEQLLEEHYVTLFPTLNNCPHRLSADHKVVY